MCGGYTGEHEVEELEDSKETSMVDWIKARITERTSLDGVSLIVMAGAVIIAAPIVKLLAWPALMYGIYTLVESEENDGTKD